MRIVNVDATVALRIKRLARIRRESLSETLHYLIPRIEEILKKSPTQYLSTGICNKPIKVPDNFPPIKEDDLAAGLHAISEYLLPRLIRRTDGPPPYHLDCGVTPEGLGYARLPNGRIIFDHANVTPRERTIFEFVKDKLPSGWNIVEYHMAILIQQRYQKYIDKPESIHFPAKAQLAVDAGCYVGAKAMAMLDLMGKNSRVIAIEMDEKNFNILERNIAENDLTGSIVPIHAAISDKNGFSQHRYRGTGMMGNTLVDAEYSKETGNIIETSTLDYIFSKLYINYIDYLNLQLNGAEEQALIGMESWEKR